MVCSPPILAYQGPIGKVGAWVIRCEEKEGDLAQSVAVLLISRRISTQVSATHEDPSSDYFSECSRVITRIHGNAWRHAVWARISAPCVSSSGSLQSQQLAAPFVANAHHLDLNLLNLYVNIIFLCISCGDWLWYKI